MFCARTSWNLLFSYISSVKNVCRSLYLFAMNTSQKTTIILSSVGCADCYSEILFHRIDPLTASNWSESLPFVRCVEVLHRFWKLQQRLFSVHFRSISGIVSISFLSQVPFVYLISHGFLSLKDYMYYGTIKYSRSPHSVNLEWNDFMAKSKRYERALGRFYVN